jgi:hypothetical protein
VKIFLMEAILEKRKSLPASPAEREPVFSITLVIPASSEGLFGETGNVNGDSK